MSVSIIFVHRGPAFYLKYSLRQARKMNPDSSIYLITDTPSQAPAYVTAINLEEYSKEAKEFEKVYKHMSTNTYGHELFCFQRWFIIRNFLSRYKIDRFVYYDSDVLLFCNAEKESLKYKNFAFTVSKKIGPQCSYFSSFEILDTLCSFIFKLYTSEVYFERLVKKYNHHIENNLPGGVCDMTGFYEYQQDNPGCARDIAVIDGNSVYDDNINEPDGFELSSSGIKKINIRGNEAIGFLSGSLKSINFNSLHFQGQGKKYMHRYYIGGGFIRSRIRQELLLGYSTLRNIYARLKFSIF